MTTSTPLATELANLRDDALQAAEDLAAKLQSISNLYWQGNADAPLFRATDETLEALKAIELLISIPVREIESAA